MVRTITALWDIPEGGWGLTEHGWAARPPGTPMAALVTKHEVIEHDDGTISLSPSLKYGFPGEPYYWHGFLEHGIWRQV